MYKSLTIFLLLFHVSLVIQAKSDSLTIRSIGVNIGCKDYSSINEIVNPFIYTATAPVYSIEYIKCNEKWRKEFNLGYSHLKKHPKNLNVPQYYDLVSYENGELYRLNMDQKYLQTIHIDYFHFSASFFRKLKSHVLCNDIFYGGFSNEDLFILEGGIASPEIISISLDPGFIYEISLKNKFNIRFKNQISLLSLTVHRTYSGAVAQLDEKPDFKFYADYVLQNGRLGSLNKYLLFRSQLTLEKELSKRFLLKAGYTLQLQKVRNYRNFSSAETTLNIGLNYKF